MEVTDYKKPQGWASPTAMSIESLVYTAIYGERTAQNGLDHFESILSRCKLFGGALPRPFIYMGGGVSTGHKIYPPSPLRAMHGKRGKPGTLPFLLSASRGSWGPLFTPPLSYKVPVLPVLRRRTCPPHPCPASQNQPGPQRAHRVTPRAHGWRSRNAHFG